MKNFIIKLAKKAGQEIHQRFKSDRIFKIKTKNQIVTQADLIADKIIVSALKKKFPAYNILSEESGWQKSGSDYLWVVDPLDGTTNYSISSPLFAVQISLFFKDEPILACAYAPEMNELYFAQKNKGFFLNGKKQHVSQTAKFEKSFFTFCHGSKLPARKRALKIYSWAKFKALDSRQLGSAALETAFVAAGRTDSIVLPGAHPWDVGPGALFIREAGGRVTDFQGNEWNLKSKDFFGSNGRLHNQLLKFLKNI